MDKKKDNQIIVKIVCVIASFVLWLYVANTDNPETVQKYTVPVELIHVDSLSNSKLALITEKSYSVTVKVKGPMLEVNRLHTSDFEAKADLSLWALKQGKNRIPVTVKLKNLSNEISITEQENLWVQVTLDNYTEKTVPIKSDIPVSTKPGFKAFQPVIKPSSVLVTGAAQFVDSVTYVMVKSAQQEATKDIEMNLPVQAYDAADRIVNEVSVKPSTVDVVVPVRRTKSVSIKVVTKGNIKNNMKLVSAQADPSTIQISGDESILNAVNSIETEPVDLSAISGNDTVEVKLIVPDGITLVNSDGTVKVKVTVDSITSENFSVDIKFNGLSDKYNFTADKTKVSIVVQGPQSLISTLESTDIICTVDLSNLTEGDGHMVPVNIELPEGISIVSSSPEDVKVSITLKQANTTTQ